MNYGQNSGGPLREGSLVSGECTKHCGFIQNSVQKAKNSPYASDAGMPIGKEASDHPVLLSFPLSFLFMSSFLVLFLLSLFPPFRFIMHYSSIFIAKLLTMGFPPLKRHTFFLPYILFETENHRFEQYSKILEVDRYTLRRSFDFPRRFLVLLQMDIFCRI